MLSARKKEFETFSQKFCALFKKLLEEIFANDIKCFDRGASRKPKTYHDEMMLMDEIVDAVVDS